MFLLEVHFQLNFTVDKIISKATVQSASRIDLSEESSFTVATNTCNKSRNLISNLLLLSTKPFRVSGSTWARHSSDNDGCCFQCRRCLNHLYRTKNTRNSESSDSNWLGNCMMRWFAKWRLSRQHCQQQQQSEFQLQLYQSHVQLVAMKQDQHLWKSGRVMISCSVKG